MKSGVVKKSGLDSSIKFTSRRQNSPVGGDVRTSQEGSVRISTTMLRCMLNNGELDSEYCIDKAIESAIAKDSMN